MAPHPKSLVRIRPVSLGLSDQVRARYWGLPQYRGSGTPCIPKLMLGRAVTQTIGRSIGSTIRSVLDDRAGCLPGVFVYHDLMPPMPKKSPLFMLVGGSPSTCTSTLLAVAAVVVVSANCRRSPSSTTATPPCDLRESGACPNGDLSHQQLGGVSLRGANLSKTSFVGTDLTDADLSNADLTSADLSVATLVRTRLHGANLGTAVLISVNARGADFEGASLNGATVSGVFSGANFRGADLTGAISGNCLGNSPTSSAKAPRTPTAVRCALRHLNGRGLVCPDGSVEPDRGADWANCKGHLTRTP